MEDHQCYAVRRLNPFQGVIQIIKCETARALSLDGINWEIQIKAKRPDDMWGGTTCGKSTTQFLRFGNWSSVKGLRKVPAHPLLDLTTMFRKADDLISLIMQEQEKLPYPLEDKYELWLLDSHRMPLALISAATSPNILVTAKEQQWRCGYRSNRDFTAPAWDENNSKYLINTNSHPHMSALERQVRIAAGHTLCQWFERTVTGEGIGIALEGFSALSGRRLDMHSFPELLLREESCDNDLAAAYLRWISPYLLTLQLLSDKTRKMLEQQARHRALLVERNWKLYPKVIDPTFINTTRIEAQLRQINLCSKSRR